MKYFFKCRICGCEGWTRDRTPVDLQIPRSEVCGDCLKVVHGIEYVYDANEDLDITPIPAGIPDPDDTIYDQLDIAGAVSTLADAMCSGLVPEDDDEDRQYRDALKPLQSYDLAERFAADLFNPDAYLDLDAALTRAYYAGVVAALRYIKNKEETKMTTAINEFYVSVIAETNPSFGDWYCQELHELIKARFVDYDSCGILLREMAVAEVVAASDNAIIQNTDSYRHAVEAIKEGKA